MNILTKLEIEFLFYWYYQFCLTICRSVWLKVWMSWSITVTCIALKRTTLSFCQTGTRQSITQSIQLDLETKRKATGGKGEIARKKGGPRYAQRTNRFDILTNIWVLFLPSFYLSPPLYTLGDGKSISNIYWIYRYIHYIE